jgi:hypothetical protein
MKIFVYMTIWWQKRDEGKRRGKEVCREYYTKDGEKTGIV